MGRLSSPRGSRAAPEKRDPTSVLQCAIPDPEQRRRFWLLAASVAARAFLDGLATSHMAKVSAGVLGGLEKNDPDLYYAWLPHCLWMFPVSLAMVYTFRLTNLRCRTYLQLQCMRSVSAALFASRDPAAQPFYHLQSVAEIKAYEFQMCEDSIGFAGDFMGIIMNVANATTAVIFFKDGLDANANLFLRFIFFVTLFLIFQTAIWAVVVGKVPALIFDMVNNVRTLLTRVLSNVEAIALFRGGDSELARVRAVHARVLEARLELMARWSLGAFVVGLLGMVVLGSQCYTVLSDLIEGRRTLAETKLLSQILGNFLGRLAPLVYLPVQISFLDVRRVRLLAVFREVERLSEAASGIATEELQLGDGAGPALELRAVALRAPGAAGGKGLALLEGLSLEVLPGEPLLIAGDTGTGKSALLFALSGVWTAGSGLVRRCPRSAVLCLPQRPYTFLGTLREQLLYPYADAAALPDERLWEVLETVNLASHFRRCGLDSSYSWDDVLSPGQQQRVSAARALLHPSEIRLLLLDEATSSLDLQNERRVYEALQQGGPRCLVSVGHRQSIRRYHTHLLTLRAAQEEGIGTALASAELSRMDRAEVEAAPPPPLLAAAGREPPAAGAQCADPDSSSPRREEVEEELLPKGGEREGPRKRGVMDRLSEALGEPYSTIITCSQEVWWKFVTSPEVLREFRKMMLRLALPLAGLVVSGSKIAVDGRKFVRLLAERDRDRAWDLARTILLLHVVALVAMPFLMYFGMRFFIWMSERLRLHLLERFLGGQHAAYYSIRLWGGLEDDNAADMLTSTDCDSVVGIGLFALGSVIPCFMMLSVFAQLFVWSPLWSSAMLVPVLAVAGPVALRGSQAVLREHMAAIAQRAAACLRAAHVREHAEAVALLGGGPAELARIDENLREHDKAVRSVQIIGDNVSLAKQCTGALLGALHEAAVGRRVLGGLAKLADYQDNIIMLNLALSIIGLVQQISGAFSMPAFASSKRVREFHMKLEEAARTLSSGGILLGEPRSSDDVLELRSLALAVPSRSGSARQQPLVAGVAARIRRGESLLIVGESGLGKSSLLRAVAGLWTHGSGAIHRPSDTGVVFFAQRPYLCLGTLREQVLYPDCDRPVPDEDIAEALRKVDLAQLLASPGLGDAPTAAALCATAAKGGGTVEALEAAQRWTAQLSRGEVQRLGFARLLLREGVELTLFDEGTSAMDAKHEALVYGLLRESTGSYASVAHRPQLRQWHTHVLLLEEAGEEGSASETAGLSRARFLPMAEYDREAPA